MTDFRTNVIDILDEWFPDYDNTLPCDQPALNAGHVQLKCFINNTCPFYKTPYKEDSIIFNFETYEEIKDLMPDRITKSLMTTPGVEGLHFEPRKVFRHNYMNRYDPNKDDADYSESADMEERLDNFSVYYKSVSASTIAGADKTLYRKEYEWVVDDSVFSKLSCSGASVEECNTEAQWVYDSQSVPINRMEEADIKLDYTPGYFQKYLDSMIEDEAGNPILKPKTLPKVQQYNIQMPVQSNIYNEHASGIHWKVVKRTPIFKGADFFVRFYKKASEPVKYLFSSTAKITVSFNDPNYFPLDYTYDKTIQVDPLDKNETFVNEAVRSSKESEKSNLYDFYTQAYYIIEMDGKVSKDKDEKYFIIIPARGNPIFVHFFMGDDASGYVSKRLGRPFRGVSGEQLINADFFDVVVRNHLGRLVIQFEGAGLNDVPPWIVERIDRVPKKLTATQIGDGETSYMVEEPRDLVIPKCQIKLWGGNIKCGFLFGILQYEESHVSFIYPPRNLDDSVNAGETEDKAFTSITPGAVSFSADYFESDPIWLPMNRDDDGEYKLSFVANDGPQLERGSIGDSTTEFHNVPLFTQDAQYYKNYNDGGSTKWEKGYFYYNRPIKEFSEPTPGGIEPKTSNIIIQKYKYLNYDRTRHQGFNTYIGMMCGDHYFDGKTDLNINGMADVSDSTASINTPPATGWYLRNCKTPILASVRLIAEPSEKPRWDDGTSISGGVKKDPTQGESRYFIDASDHVMSFSHSWTSSSLTSLEHSGTIQFYLNHNMIVENMYDNPINNVTNDLLALQDKTFYIEIWAGYRDRNTMGTENSGGCDHSNYTRIPGFYKMFTGMCSGGSISYEYNKHIMTCRINDYTIVLKNMLFFNSPWFDAMKDATAIREILRMAGFRDQGTYDPATLINGIADDSTAVDEQSTYQHFDGRIFKYVNFGLPSGYNRLEQPALKFNDGDPLIDAISKISAYSAKIFYFDEWGIAHYEDYQDIVEEDFQGEVRLEPLYHFTMNPEIIPGQVIFNKIERSFDVDSVYTHLKTLTNTPDMHVLIRDRLKWETIENPETSGFLGYQKTFFQGESMFGSKEAQISAMNKYAIMFKPTVSVKFETYGLPLRATDIISVQGEIVRVIKVDHNFNAEKNEWWMNVDCQRFQAIDPADIVSSGV